MVALLLAKGAEIDPFVETWDSETLLHAATRGGCKILAEQIISKGADVNARANIEATPLFMAADNEHHDMVDLLLAHGAKIDPNFETRDKETLLHAAARGGCKKLAEQIIAKGAVVRIIEVKGNRVVVEAAQTE